MRKTKADLIASEADARRTANVYSLALHCVIHEAPDAHETIEDDDGSAYLLRLYRADGAHGGILVTTRGYIGNDSPMTEATYFEDTLRHEFLSLAHRCAVERLDCARRRMWSKAS